MLMGTFKQSVEYDSRIGLAVNFDVLCMNWENDTSGFVLRL